jgi:hypothetical protein
VHPDYLRFTHELDVRLLLLTHFLARSLSKEWICAFTKLVHFILFSNISTGLKFELESVFTSQIFKVFLVLDIDLLKDLLKILRLDPLHVTVKFLDLFGTQLG